MSIGQVLRHILYLDRTVAGNVQVKVLKSNLGFDPQPNHMLIGCNPEQGLTFGSADVRGFTSTNTIAPSSAAHSKPAKRRQSEYTEAFYLNPLESPGPKEKREYAKHVILNRLAENMEKGKNLIECSEVCVWLFL